MPVYLCQSGEGQIDPWRTGVQVFSSPCPIDVDPSSNTTSGGNDRDLVVAGWSFSENNNATQEDQQQGGASVVSAAGRGTRSSAALHSIRRVRHAELVLVDDVCIAYNRYWLRLRWPGHKGGFAGYIAMGLVSEGTIRSLPKELSASSTEEDQPISEDADMDDPTREETGSMPPAEPGDSTRSLICARTGLPFQSSQTMKLLALYDDGVTPPVALAPLPTESVFCRICREGLHDDADDEQPEAEEDGDEANSRRSRTPRRGERTEDPDEPIGVDPMSSASKGPVVPHPAYSLNADAVRNPMLAPCECSGSMAFVHYLCVEQWRCRSRHPDALNGLNCETCGSAYALPPPSEREVHVPQFDQDQDDWLEAMPPHVMQALRQPHISWQIGAWIVRRRWLRPIAPVLMSPIVALYCRARRHLKKRGVARRRWACSLCRRRARWKCVRCLRSYYCSRQCQNVSWHIIHKHVCYKPVRFWWSVIFYSAITLLIFPGILRDPLMYDVGLFSVPVSFVISGILGGSGATLVKKTTGVDLRGRMLEFVVLISTLILTYLTWGLIRGFFGDASACHGTLGKYEISAEDLATGFSLVRLFQTVILKPAKWLYLSLDNFFLVYTGPWIRSALCGNNRESVGCFEHLPHANEDFFLQEEGGERCAGDLVLLLSLYLLALVSFAGSALAKSHERRQRRERWQRQQGRRVFPPPEPHFHQE